MSPREPTHAITNEPRSGDSVLDASAAQPPLRGFLIELRHEPWARAHGYTPSPLRGWRYASTPYLFPNANDHSSSADSSRATAAKRGPGSVGRGPRGSSVYAPRTTETPPRIIVASTVILPWLAAFQA